MPEEPRAGGRSVTAAALVVAAVGLYDLGVGAYMLWASEPWAAHGPGTLWAWFGREWAGLGAEAQRAQMSLLRRIGAFSFYAGLVSLFVALRFFHNRRELLAFMLLYMLAGLGFAVTDRAFFAGTPYYLVKQVIGGVWVVALLVLWRAPYSPNAQGKGSTPGMS